MCRSLLVLVGGVIVSVAVGTVGCARSSGHGLGGAEQGNRSGEVVRSDSSWSLSYFAKCSSAEPDHCPGAYGFSVASDGSFHVGPGPQGQALSGHLSEDDLKRLEEVAGGIRNHPDFAALEDRCDPAKEGELFETVEWKSAGHTETVFKSADASECFNATGSRETGASSRALLHQLTRKYSPDIFPNPCVDASWQLEKSFDSLTSCEQDSDCAYVDTLFTPIETNSDDAVFVDDCTYAHPLAVGNTFAVVSHQLELILKRRLVEQVCGAETHRPQCETGQSFSPRGRAPVCAAGKCRIHPSIVNS